MALRMATLRRRKSGTWGARITIPKDVRADYQALYAKHVEELFYAGPDCPRQRAQVLFSEWQANIKSRIATLGAQQRGEGHDLTQREARALAGEWYRWYVGQHEENPGRPRGWQGGGGAGRLKMMLRRPPVIQRLVKLANSIWRTLRSANLSAKACIPG